MPDEPMSLDPMEPLDTMAPMEPMDTMAPMEPMGGGEGEAYSGPEQRSDSDENHYRRSIYDVPVTVNISVGRKKLSVAELLRLQPETVIALTAGLEDPVDLTIDDRVIARGELIETDEGTLAVRVTEIEEQANG